MRATQLQKFLTAGNCSLCPLEEDCNTLLNIKGHTICYTVYKKVDKEIKDNEKEL